MNALNNRRLSTITRRTPKFALVLAPIVILIILGGIVLTITSQFVVNDYTSCQVTRTETVNVQDAHQKRVYTNNCGVFTVEDSIFHGVWNSADLYGSIQDGQTYDFTATGWRIPVLSQFPNIISITLTK